MDFEKNYSKFGIEIISFYHYLVITNVFKYYLKSIPRFFKKKEVRMVASLRDTVYKF